MVNKHIGYVGFFFPRAQLKLSNYSRMVTFLFMFILRAHVSLRARRALRSHDVPLNGNFPEER